MHAFPTSSICTTNTNNQHLALKPEDNTNINASVICSRSLTPPPLSPITKASMHTTTDEGSEWLTQGTYTLLTALFHLGTTTSTTQVTNTTPCSDESDTDRSVSVYMENTCSTNIQEGLRDLCYKCICISEQQEQEDKEREWSRANRVDSKDQEAEKDAWPGSRWIATTSESFTVPNENGTFA